VRVRIGADHAQEFLQHRKGGHEPFRAGALEGQLRGHLMPALADLPQHARIGHEHALHHHLVEVVGAGQDRYRADADAG
jgi:hypothetical protein